MQLEINSLMCVLAMGERRLRPHERALHGACSAKGFESIASTAAKLVDAKASALRSGFRQVHRAPKHIQSEMSYLFSDCIVPLITAIAASSVVKFQCGRETSTSTSTVPCEDAQEYGGCEEGAAWSFGSSLVVLLPGHACGPFEVPCVLNTTSGSPMSSNKCGAYRVSQQAQLE